MAVNTGAKQFRKVDVDQFDDDRFEDETGDGSTAVGPNGSEVNGLLSKYPFKNHKRTKIEITFFHFHFVLIS